MFRQFFGLVVLLAMLFPFTIAVKADEQETGFSGSRTFVCRIDSSDLNNYVNGGRGFFDFILRQNKPEWLGYQIHTVERDVTIQFQFDFQTYADYVDKVTGLLGYTPSIIYRAGNKPTYMENFNTIDLLNFVEIHLKAGDSFSEFSKDDLFHVTEGAFVLNGATHPASKRVNICLSDNVIVFNSIDISTTGEKNGSFTRKITVEISSESGEDIISTVKEQFKQIEKPIIEEGTAQVSVQFDANDRDELITKTMLALNSAETIKETEEFIDDTTVGVWYREFFDLEQILNKDGAFRYSYEFPSYYNNATKTNEDSKAYVSDGKVTYSNREGLIDFRYERGFRFDSIIIDTDLTNLFGKIKRSIRFVSTVSNAAPYHEKVKAELEKDMIRGMTLNISDDASSRCYEITFESWFVDDISNFTKTVVKGACTFQLDRNGLPFQKSQISDTLKINSVISKMAPPNTVQAKYQFPQNVKFRETENKDIITDGTVCSMVGGNSLSIEINYSSIRLVSCLILFVPILVIVIVILIIVRKAKRFIKKRKEKKMQEGQNMSVLSQQTEPLAAKTQPQPLICSDCGHEMVGCVQFCENCGAKVDEKPLATAEKTEN